MKLYLVLAASAALAMPSVASAQQTDIPPSERPPAGMCRIWLDDVPAAQQPAPTDCATAVKNRPQKGRVIFGDDYAAKKRPSTTRKPTPVITGFSPKQPATKRPRPSPPIIRP